MDFALLLAVAGVIGGFRWWRSGKTVKAVIFHGVIHVYTQLWHRWQCDRSDPLPPTGAVLLICNHTSSADPPMLQAASSRVLCWLSSREHYEGHPLVRKLLDTLHCVPVRRDGKDALAARGGLRRLQEGRALCIFPEGNLSGVGRGRLRMPRVGAAWLALRSGATVVPAWISGGPRTHRLVRAWALPSRRGVRVAFGKPVDMSRFLGKPINRPLMEEVAMHLMKEIESLASAKRGTVP